MIDLFRAGGFSMWIVLAFGLAAMIASFGLLRDPDPRRLATVRALTWAEAFAIVAGTASNLIAVFTYVARHDDGAALYQGLAEALSPAGVRPTLLSGAWLRVPGA